MIEPLIEKIFQLRNMAHIAHWKTKSYSEHKALEEYYEGVIIDLDRLIETYQGAFGLVGKIEPESKSIKKDIKEQALWLTENRAEIAQSIPAIENILDELTALHMKTLYKLENLR